MNIKNPVKHSDKEQIENQLNNGTPKEDYDYGELIWSFDVGAKLDYDGSIIRVNSRFYLEGDIGKTFWSGSVGIIFMQEEISEKNFKCANLDELKYQVEEYVKDLCSKIRNSLKNTIL